MGCCVARAGPGDSVCLPPLSFSVSFRGPRTLGPAKEQERKWKGVETLGPGTVLIFTHEVEDTSTGPRPCKAPVPEPSVIFCAKWHFYDPRSFLASTPSSR